MVRQIALKRVEPKVEGELMSEYSIHVELLFIRQKREVTELKLGLINHEQLENFRHVAEFTESAKGYLSF